MDPISGSMKAELIILARKSQGKPAPRGNGPSRAALRRRGLVEPYGDALTRRGWNWYQSYESNGDVADFLHANGIDPWQEESDCSQDDFSDIRERASEVSDRDTSKASSTKAKPISQKSYGRWLHGCLERMKAFESEQDVLPCECSVWTILAEEELRVLEELKPLLDMDDIRKCKELAVVREDLAAQAHPVDRELAFDFSEALDAMPGLRKSGLRHSFPRDGAVPSYPLLKACDAHPFRELCAERLHSELRRVLPSLSRSKTE